jgi:hypothetical protein
MMPEVSPILATAVLLLDQMPPVVASVTVHTELAQTVSQPDIEAGNGFTVRHNTEEHPVPRV